MSLKDSVVHWSVTYFLSRDTNDVTLL